MMLRTLPIALAVGILSSCSLFSGGRAEEAMSSSAASSTSVRETHNVFYRGIIEPAGITVYQEGTHRLSMDNGTFVLLESTTVDLNGYVDEEVEVYGSVRPTAEAGGMIMEVDRIEMMTSSSSSFSLSSSSQGVSSVVSLASSEAVSSIFPDEGSPPSYKGAETAITSMSKDRLSDDQWTQKYCTSHIGFCIPIHRNWWFTSFGATSSSLWHVEVGSAAIENLGDGAILIRLVSGSLEQTGMQDNETRTDGSTVIGYHAWTDNRHFEITADSRLSPAVSFMVERITPYKQP